MNTLPWPSAAGPPRSPCVGPSVVLLDPAVGVHGVADVRAAFVAGVQAQEKVDTVKVFHLVHHNSRVHRQIHCILFVRNNG